MKTQDKITVKQVSPVHYTLIRNENGVETTSTYSNRAYHINGYYFEWTKDFEALLIRLGRDQNQADLDAPQSLYADMYHAGLIESYGEVTNIGDYVATKLLIENVDKIIEVCSKE